MQFTTKTGLPVGEISISHRDNIILIGSCFAGNIAGRLKERKFNISSNPFGVQYNPLSIARVLNRVVACEPFGEHSPEIFEHNGKWHSIMHHGDFSRASKEELLECINSSLVGANAMVGKCSVVVVTFGTAYVYTRKSDGCVAGNCHKLPGVDFDRRLLGVKEIADEFGKVIERFRAMNGDVRFLFTVSPIRHLRDGAHDNQKSKSTLLLAVDEIIGRYNDCHYFPAYEIMLDELRDYRFYAEDMVHPSAVAVEYIWECFSECYFDENTKAMNRGVEEVVRGLGHRPFDVGSEGYRRFVSALIGKMESLAAKYPQLDFENEIKQCNTLLDR